VQYSIDYIHILSFREEYKKAVIPYFGFENLRYGIENENTINESIKLIFPLESIAIIIKKEGISCIFEGEVQELKRQQGIMHPFWEIYDKIKDFAGYRKTTRQSIICHAVELYEEDKMNKIFSKNPYLTKNPFGKLKEFGCNYEYGDKEKYHLFSFGNYSEQDIKKYELRPFESDSTTELVGAVGLMCKTEIRERNNTVSYSKFKTILSEAERIISSYHS